MPGGAAEPLFFVPSAADTANTLNVRAVSFDPHDGQSTFSFELIDRTNFSNF